MPDKYDEAITYLTDRPDEILTAWTYGGAEQVNPYGCLLRYTGSGSCGCLTQVRAGANGPSPQIEMAIRSDNRIPMDPGDITPEHLPVFAEWQRKLDAWHAENEETDAQ